jgi:hypothetical protein
LKGNEKKIEMIGFVCETGCRERQGCGEGRRRDGGKDQRQLRDPLTVCYGKGFGALQDTQVNQMGRSGSLTVMKLIESCHFPF